MAIFQQGLEKRRQGAEAFVNANLEAGERLSALLSYAAYSPPEEPSAGERLSRLFSFSKAAKAATGQPRGLAVTDERVLVFDYPEPQATGPGKSAATVGKSILKARSLEGGVADLEQSPERVVAAYSRAEISVREWAEGGRLNRALELELPDAETLSLKVGKPHWSEAESVVRALEDADQEASAGPS